MPKLWNKKPIAVLQAEAVDVATQQLMTHGDEPDYDGMLELFPQSYHEPYYASYLKEDFGAMASACGLMHIRNVNAFVSKVMVFDKP
jgi:hypothetical protein